MSPTTTQRTRRTATPADRHVARSRRRFARRQWRRRWLVWRHVAVVVVLVGLAAAAVWAVWFSSLLAVEDVEVRGTSRLSQDAVVAAARVPLGGPLVGVDLDSVRLRVGSLALVDEVEVTRHWPHTVLVQVSERTPVALVSLGPELRGLDAEGQILAPVVGAPPDLPRVQSPLGVSADALAEAARVVAALPNDLAASVDHVEVQTVDRISLELGDGRLVRWGSADDSERKAEVLTALLRQPRAAEYDVSVPELPTTRG